MSEARFFEEEDIGADLFASTVFDKIRKYKYVIFSCLFFGFLTYMFVFTNKLVNWDELTAIFSKGATIESGRWGLEVLSYIIPNYSMPWFFGCVTLACMTASVCLIVKTFSIRSKSVQIALSGVIIAFPSLIGTFAYMFTSSSYGVSFLLAMIALTLFVRRGWHWHITAVICTVLSVSIYQSYVMVLSSLLILFLIQRIMYSDSSAKDIFYQGLSFLLYLVLSMVVYFTTTKLVNFITQIPMGAYAEHAMGSTLPIAERIKLAYSSFFDALFQNEKGLVSFGISQYAHILIVFFIIMECIIYITEKRNVLKGLLLILMLTVLPVSIFGMYLATAPGAVHTLVLYSFIAVYVLAAIIIDSKRSDKNISITRKRFHNIMGNTVVLGMLIITLCNASLANEAYLKMYLSHQNIISFSTSLVTKLNTIQGYKQSTPIAFIGEYSTPNFYNKFDNITNIIGFPTLTPNWRTLYYYCGYDIAMASSEEIESLKESPQVQQMPVYPDYDSIQMINGTVVVKFSN